MLRNIPRFLLSVGLTIPLGVAIPASVAAAGAGARLAGLSFEELMLLEVSTVSRKTEQWWEAPGAIDVVTGDDIRRSGVQSLPDALRLATGVHVGQPNAREWAVGIRGFNVLASNKLNVQLDGRSLFTPFFSGVLWNAQDTLLEDVDRIEVLRGPGGALWGPFAVNGFIQILTKPAWATQGWLASAGAGTEDPGFVSARYGGRAGEATFYRVYAKYSQYAWTKRRDGRRTQSATDMAQTGFRTDTRGPNDTTFTLIGDAYTNKGTPKDRVQNEVAGANLTAHAARLLTPDSDLNARAYFDYTAKDFAVQFRERRKTLSGSLTYRVSRGAHEFQFGAEGLGSWDEVSGPQITFEPARDTYVSASAFARDTISLVPQRWKATLGGQLLYSGYSGFDVQPTLRLAWTPASRTTVWAAVSRAVRTPVRIDRDLVARFGPLLAFEGNNDLKPEVATAYELGWRHSFMERLAVDVSAFVNHYDDVRSYESGTPTFMAFPWTFRNTTNVDAAGFEVAVLAQPAARVFIKGSYRYLDLEFTKDPGSGDFRDGVFEMNDPRHVAALTTRLDLPGRVEFDATLRYASDLPNPAMDGYVTGDARLGWSPREEWELSLVGRNLFQPQYRDFITPNAPNEELSRGVSLRSTWRF